MTKPDIHPLKCPHGLALDECKPCLDREQFMIAFTRRVVDTANQWEMQGSALWPFARSVSGLAAHCATQMAMAIGLHCCSEPELCDQFPEDLPWEAVTDALP